MTETTAGYSVLVVEDDPNHRLLLQRTLTAPGTPFAIVQLAGDSEEAERFARQMVFDCLLVDNRIPGLRGLDLIAQLRAGGVVAPCVLMTSAGSEDLVVRAYRQQVADYVIKETGFWREVPKLLARVIEVERGRRREATLRAELALAHGRLDDAQGRLMTARIALQACGQAFDSWAAAGDDQERAQGLLESLGARIRQATEALADPPTGPGTAR